MKKVMLFLGRIPSPVWDLIILAALFWVVRYWHNAQFGLYEDDLTYVPRAAGQQVGELLTAIGKNFLPLADQGRPLHHGFIRLFSRLGWYLTPMQGAYWL